MRLTEEELQLFEVAYNLGIPLYRLLDEMTFEEFLGWSEYFKLRPIGWREDYRASLIIKAFGSKINANKLFPSLEVISKSDSKKNLAESLVQSPFFQKMLASKDGDHPDFLKGC